MKYILLISAVFLGLWGCATTVNTALMGPGQRLDYAIKLYSDKDYQEAIKEFQAIILQYPGNVVVDSAQYYLGECHYQRDEYILGAYEFSRLVKNMPASKFVPDAQYMLAECYFQLSPYYELDQKYTKKAISEFQAFIDFFPTNTRVPDAEKKIAELNDKLAHKEYHTAYIYTKLDDYIAATMYYDYVLDTYHDTKYAPLALYGKINVLVIRKKNSEALEDIAQFIEKYPTDSHVKELQKLKTTLEGKSSTDKNG
jgi:outer membrane protein assembly factor BamD